MDGKGWDGTGMDKVMGIDKVIDRTGKNVHQPKFPKQ